MPQIQFIHIRWVFQLWRRDKFPQCMLYSSRCSSWTRFLTCPLWCFDRCLVRRCRKLWFSRSCSPSLAVDFPFVLQRLIPMVQTVQQIIETPQLQFVFLGGRSLLFGSCRFSGAAVETTLALPTVAVQPQVLCGSENCGDSAVAVHLWSSIFPVVVQRPIPMVFLLLLNTVIDVPVAQFVQFRASCIAPCIWQSLVQCSVFAFGAQDYGLFWRSLQECFPYATLIGSTADT